MPLTPKGMIRMLEKNGFIHIKSNNGSHQKYFNPQTNVTIIIPLHARELGKGLEQAILKRAGLKR